jgi:uncharacterized protein (DUF2062 family)
MTSDAPGAEPRICVILPARHAVDRVIGDVLAACRSIIVAGPADSLPPLPRDCEGATAVCRDGIPGIGAALEAGFARAKAMGFTHAVTIEADSPYLREDLPALAKFGACIGLGVTCGILPLWGIQMAIAALAAHALKLSKPLVIAASNVSIPIMIPPILYVSLLVGRLLLPYAGGAMPPAHLLSPATVWLSTREYLLGSVVLAAAAGVISGVASYLAARVIVAFRWA